jgi:hypothetical protein
MIVGWYAGITGIDRFSIPGEAIRFLFSYRTREENEMQNNPVHSPVLPATSEDIKAITSTSRDYIEGWFTADEERIRRCLHPELVKRTIWHIMPENTWQLSIPRDAEMMAQFTREGGGSDAPESERTYEITILDIFRHIATVRVSSHPFMDYLHLAKINEQWLIVNVLWELQQGEINPSS